MKQILTSKSLLILIKIFCTCLTEIVKVYVFYVIKGSTSVTSLSFRSGFSHYPNMCDLTMCILCSWFLDKHKFTVRC